jgi:hypothetical protein
MSSTGTAPARAIRGPASVNSDHRGFEPKPVVPARVREGAHWFFWIVALATMNSVFIIFGSHIHRVTGLGVGAVMDKFAQPSGSGKAMQVIVSGWMSAGFLFLGYCAAEGRKWAFAVGMAAYAVDGALAVAAGDYLGAVFHVGMLYAISRGFAALGRPSGSEPSDVASAGLAG